MAVDYDTLAHAYDGRYAEHDYGGVERALRSFCAGGRSALEVGCGTGHWLWTLRSDGCPIAGVDASLAMLRVARDKLGRAHIALGRAEALPYDEASFDRVFLVNVLHHVADPARCFAEVRRVLRPGGRLLTIGLDPSAGQDRWYVYDYFDGTLEADCARYPNRASIRAWLERAGLEGVATSVAQRMTSSAEAEPYLERGAAAKHSSSQLALLDDDRYEAGLRRIRDDMRRARAAGDTLRLRGELTLYATEGGVARARSASAP